jgi:protein-disulfide isomerase
MASSQRWKACKEEDETAMNQTLRPPVSAEDHRQGIDSALVTLVEYGDFECPHCGHAFPIVEEVRRRLGDKLLFAFRHFPLAEIHPHAQAAAEAAEAAGSHGKFWGMHDMLFRHQDALDMGHLSQYAAKLGLDTQEFAQNLTERKFKNRVRENFMTGARSGVNGTPTFFINGVRYDGYVDPDEITNAIEDAASVL